MLQTKICKVKLENPTVLASGILGVSGKLMCRVAANGAGAVTTKSVFVKEREGHANPTVLAGEDFVYNAVGLSGPGAEEEAEEIAFIKKNSKVPVIASIAGGNVKEFGIAAKKISAAKPDLIEVNISCPNVEHEFGKPFGTDAKISAKVTETVKENTSIPIIVKLSPNVDDIGKIAKAVEAAGADAISAINTVGPEMIKDKKTGKPFLANKKGGVSGPKILPIALDKVKQIYNAVKIPVIGIGGVTYGKDAVAMIKAGASAVGIGSAVYFREMDVFKKICDEMKVIMKKQGFKSIEEMIGRGQ
ncbi:dihydroorotate dehydrogenase [Candidatus Woesearchaeota archaeon]|nr:dihydroorotate dehydrogenase [Candidatus Woesearchaeota archaeon]